MAAAPKKLMISMSGLDLSFLYEKPSRTAKVISFKAESDKRRRKKAAATKATRRTPPKRRA